MCRAYEAHMTAQSARSRHSGAVGRGGQRGSREVRPTYGTLRGVAALSVRPCDYNGYYIFYTASLHISFFTHEAPDPHTALGNTFSPRAPHAAPHYFLSVYFPNFAAELCRLKVVDSGFGMQPAGSVKFYWCKAPTLSRTRCVRGEVDGHFALCRLDQLPERSSSLTTASVFTNASDGMGGTAASSLTTGAGGMCSCLTKAPAGIGGTAPLLSSSLSCGAADTSRFAAA